MFRKYAVADVLSVESVDASGRSSTGMVRQAHRAVFDYVSKPGFIYVRSRAISSRCNDNFDYFGADEIKKAYRTFVGKPVFVNHHNDDHKRMRGLVIDAALHEDRNPDGSPDTWVEALMEIDAQRFPRLAKALINGDIDKTSMGTDVQISICSACGNKATTPLEYCGHIPGMKGKKIKLIGQKTAKLIYEECLGLSFFENSLLVEPPADPTALFLGKPVIGPGLEHLAAKTAADPRDQVVRMHPRDLMQYVERYRTEDPGGVRHRENLAAGIEQRGYQPRLHGGMSGDTHYSPPSSPITLVHDDQGSFFLEGNHRVHALNDMGYDKPVPVLVKDRRTQQKTAAAGDDWSVGMDDERRRKAKDAVDRLWEGFHQAIDPGSTPASRKSTRNIGVMNHLQGLGYQPHHIGFNEDDDDHPYADVHDPKGTGWYARDDTGPHLEIRHKATGNETHEMIDLQNYDKETHSQHRTPGYGPAEAEKELHNWVHGDPEETGGAAQYLEQNDDRIRHWQRRRGITRTSAADIRVVATANFGQLGAHMREHGWDGNSFRRAYHIDDGPLKDRYDWSDTGKLSPSELHAVHAWLHDQERTDWPDAWTDENGLHSHTAKKQRVQDMSDDDLAAYRESQVAGQEWVKRNPPKAEHVVAAYHRATDAEKAVGATWYADAHRTAQDLSRHTGVTHDQATDLIANYSPGAHWSSNLHAAVHVARTGKPVGGPGAASGGFNATTSQADHAQRILTEHAQTADVFGKTANKVRAFAHLIRHGGNEDDGDPQVCVDRHAASVACGARVPDNAEGYVPLDSQRGYGSFKKAYVDASKTISETESKRQGRPVTVHPHQVQAATWLVQQRENEQSDKKTLASSRTAGNAAASTRKLMSYVGEHFPDWEMTAPGTGYSRQERDDIRKSAMLARLGYGETVAPRDVDTLRQESCAVCGSDIYNGRECNVCGYIAPPAPFSDPDVDKAAELDELKEGLQEDLAEADESRIKPVASTAL